MPFTLEQEKNEKLSFLDIEVSPEKGKFVTTIYGKSTFSGVYMHFESVFPSVFLEWFILLLVTASKFVLIRQSFMKILA